MTQEEKIDSLARIEEQIGVLRDAAGFLATGEEFPGRSKATRIWFALKKIVPSPASESKFKPDNDPGPYYNGDANSGDGVEWDLGEKAVRVITFESVEDFVSKKQQDGENFDIEAVSLSFFEFLLSKLAGPGKTLDKHWVDFWNLPENAPQDPANSDASSEGENAENAGENEANEAEAAQQGEGENADAQAAAENTQAETQATTKPTTKKNGKK